MEARPRQAICRDCAEPVLWVRTVNEDQRSMLFNGNTVPKLMKIRHGHEYWYLDPKDCHWLTCASRQ